MRAPYNPAHACPKQTRVMPLCSLWPCLVQCTWPSQSRRWLLGSLEGTGPEKKTASLVDTLLFHLKCMQAVVVVVAGGVRSSLCCSLATDVRATMTALLNAMRRNTGTARGARVA